MSFKTFLSESVDPLQFLKWNDKMLGDLKTWLDGFQLESGKSPKGLTKQWKNLQFLKKQLDTPFGVRYDNIKATFSWMTKEDLELIDSTMGNKKIKINSIGNKYATYYNESMMAEKTFLSRVSDIEKFLATLKGAHKKALTVKPLIIKFVKKEKSSATAKYKTMEDMIYIRPDRKAIDGDKYGSFIYIIIHELGHRYESLVKNMQSLHQVYTTKYSRTDSMSGNEAFAELFAISHFGPTMYPEYKDQIAKFNKEIL